MTDNFDPPPLLHGKPLQYRLAKAAMEEHLAASGRLVGDRFGRRIALGHCRKWLALR